MDQSLQIRRIDKAVHVQINGMGVGMSWDRGAAFAEAIKRIGAACKAYADHARATGDLSRATEEHETVGEISIKAAGPALIVELQGKRWFECNYREAPVIYKGVLTVTRAMEEEANAQAVISDEAFLLRTGLPVGLSSNSKIKREAWKQAEDVNFPGMVEPQTVFYPPTIILHPPTTPAL